jgi:hypothetical protein
MNRVTILKSYEIRVPPKIASRTILSPLEGQISKLTGLVDIGESLDKLGDIDENLLGNPLSAEIQWNGPKSKINAALSQFERIIQFQARYAKFKSNLRFYLRMGDFRDKSIHDGTNLTGPYPELASENVKLRQYRVSLMTMGRIADIDMYKHTLGGMSSMAGSNPLSTDPKPGVYTPYEGHR